MFDCFVDGGGGNWEEFNRMCEKLSAQSPAGNILMGEALNGMMLENYSPETAAAYVQYQLDNWYLMRK